MKILIDISESEYRQVIESAEPRMFAGMLQEAVSKGVAIPESATNGDVIKAMFPDVKIRWITQTKIGVTFINNQDYITEFDAKWWNAPYKGARS